MPEKPLLTAGEVAALFGVHAKTIRRWVEEGKFPAPSRIGGQERWTNLSVGVWLIWQDYAPEPVIERPNLGGTQRDVEGAKRDIPGHPPGGR